MKNKEILLLANSGIFSATAHCLPPLYYYQWYKFRRDLKDALENLAKAQSDLLAEYGIVHGHEDEADELEKEKYVETFKLLLEEDAPFSVKTRIPFDFYKKLYDENMDIAVFKTIVLEELLINSLFDGASDTN